jgi:hypothetical protein
MIRILRGQEARDHGLYSEEIEIRSMIFYEDMSQYNRFWSSYWGTSRIDR